MYAIRSYYAGVQRVLRDAADALDRAAPETPATPIPLSAAVGPLNGGTHKRRLITGTADPAAYILIRNPVETEGFQGVPHPFTNRDTRIDQCAVEIEYAPFPRICTRNNFV